jgi:hypothetical protein
MVRRAIAALLASLIWTAFASSMVTAAADKLPSIAGTYRPQAKHPRVFTSADDLADITTRINVPGSFSAQRFSRLASQIKTDLAAKVDWDATYAGCEVDVYLHGFSYEPRGGYADQIRSEDQLQKAMKVKPRALAPAGAAVVASRLALYAALIDAGAAPPVGAPGAKDAVALSKRILLAWADRGFRDERGNIRGTMKQYCRHEANPAPPIAAALQISRGIVYSAHAQDLLMGLSALAPDEQRRLNRFHESMYEVIRTLSNQEFDDNLRSKYPDEVYNNQFASHVVGLLATARLADDEKRFDAALYGGDAASVSLPWTRLFNFVIYGVSDTPLLRITPNSNDDPLKSRPAYTSNVVAPGEINDRYRNADPLQGMGYPIFTLEHLYNAAEIMRIAGLDAYGYRGTHQQSIEMATQYYACYAKAAGFRKTVTVANSRVCPDYVQYIGKTVNDVQTVILLGAYRFPENAAITELEAAARAEALRDPIDSIRFGRWRD